MSKKTDGFKYFKDRYIKHPRKNPSLCNGCNRPILKGEQCLNRVFEDKRFGDVYLWYCKDCIEKNPK